MHREGTFAGAGSLQLYYQAWQPETIRGVVAIVHGLGEHSGRYQNVVTPLISNGWMVFAFDLRGHGLSPGLRIHIDRWEEYREDVRAFLHAIQSMHPDPPRFLYGHSFGALLCADSLIHNSEGWSGTILSGIAIEPAGAAKAHLVAIARLLSSVVPRFRLSLNFDIGTISRDPEVLKKYRSDKLVSGRVSVRFGTETLAAIERVKAHAGEIRLPALILHGGADRLNLPSGSKWLYETISSPDKTLRIYPGTYHEPHNDLDHELVLNDVLQWLQRQRQRL